MRRRGTRELIEEMRAERLAREAENARWREEHARGREDDVRRHERWLSEWRVRVEADRIEQKRRFDAIDAAMKNDRRVTREMILDIRANTAMLHDMRHGIQANTEGLLRVLDELRRSDGPSAAGA